MKWEIVKHSWNRHTQNAKVDFSVFVSTLHLTFFHDLVEGYTRNPGIPSTSECQEYTIVERLLQARMTKTIFLCFFKYDRKNSLRIFVKNPIRKDKKQILSLEEIFVLGKFHHFLEHTFQKQICPSIFTNINFQRDNNPFDAFPLISSILPLSFPRKKLIRAVFIYTLVRILYRILKTLPKVVRVSYRCPTMSSPIAITINSCNIVWSVRLSDCYRAAVKWRDLSRMDSV